MTDPHTEASATATTEITTAMRFRKAILTAAVMVAIGWAIGVL